MKSQTICLALAGLALVAFGAACSGVATTGAATCDHPAVQIRLDRLGLLLDQPDAGLRAARG